MSSDHQRIKWRRNIAENFNPLSRVHERYRRQTDRQTTDRRTDDDTANMNMSSRSLKNNSYEIEIRLDKNLMFRCSEN